MCKRAASKFHSSSRPYLVTSLSQQQRGKCGVVRLFELLTITVVVAVNYLEFF
jgi:hypothetical protein